MAVELNRLAQDLRIAELGDCEPWEKLDEGAKAKYLTQAGYLMTWYDLSPRIQTNPESVANAARRGYEGT